MTHGPLLTALLELTAGVRRYWLITTVFGAPRTLPADEASR